jgi:hypothetical protein
VFDYFAGTRRIRGVKASAVLHCVVRFAEMSKKSDFVSLKLSESSTLRFIQLYQSELCLYDVNSGDYRNRELRVTATKRNAAALSVDGFGPKEVATKFKILRNS